MATVTGGGNLAAKLKEIRDKVEKAHIVRIGFLEGATSDEDGLNVPTYAAINNFGAPEAGIPARPFFSNMVAKNKGDWAEIFGNGLKSLDFDAQKALEIMGVVMSDQLREEILNGVYAPNSPVTLLLKDRFPMRTGMTWADVQQAREDAANGVKPVGQHNKPLVWTSDMVNSIDSEVE